VGDKVRVLRSKELFDKNYRHWSKSVYTIAKKEGFHFIVEKDGILKDKPYKSYELQKIVGPVEEIEEGKKPQISRKELRFIDHLERKQKRDPGRIDSTDERSYFEESPEYVGVGHGTNRVDRNLSMRI